MHLSLPSLDYVYTSFFPSFSQEFILTCSSANQVICKKAWEEALIPLHAILVVRIIREKKMHFVCTNTTKYSLLFLLFFASSLNLSLSSKTCVRETSEKERKKVSAMHRKLYTRGRVLLLLLLEIPIGMAIANCLNEVKKERNCSSNNNNK